jgi:hypothetical protein
MQGKKSKTVAVKAARLDPGECSYGWGARRPFLLKSASSNCETIPKRLHPGSSEGKR